MLDKKYVLNSIVVALALHLAGCGGSENSPVEEEPIVEQPTNQDGGESDGDSSDGGNSDGDSSDGDSSGEENPDGGTDGEGQPDQEPVETTITFPEAPANLFFDGVLQGADYWSEEPKILSAGVGFADIVGIDAPELTIDSVMEAGGAWSSDIDCGTDIRNYTSTSIRDQISIAYITQTPYTGLKGDVTGIDGLPIVFSWPVDTSTVSLTDFQFTMNTGEVVTPLAVSPFPNAENNERNTIVVFGEWANRLPSSDVDARFPVKLEIVEDETPLLLVGPDNQVFNAVGMTWETASSPYDDNNGPRLVGAKLNYVNDEPVGEGISSPLPLFQPNDATAYYDEGDYQIRLLTTGGFSPDGVSGIKPNEFERFFRIHATGADGNTVVMDNVGEEYAVQGGTLRIIGLAELGAAEGGEVFYDACYDEDLDNYIDIVLVGDDAAARSITFVEIPSLAGGYSPFYNPGGPGRTPFEGVVYTQPGPADMEPVIIALDDPMRVSYIPDSTDIPVEAPIDEPEVLTLTHDDVERQYMINIPTSYTGDDAVPLLFDLHRLGATAQQQAMTSQFALISERENFIVVNPQGIGGIWTVTGFPLSGAEDDLGFIQALIDEVSQTYNIDSNRIYATGMSNGSFLAFDLACNASDTFAAIAPVSGVMTGDLLQGCAPQRPIPVLQTHGTADDQIPYEQAQVSIEWWVSINQTSTTPIVTDLDDLFEDNGNGINQTIQRFVYANGTSGVSIEHLKIEEGGHNWPGELGDSDINISEEIWQFLSRYELSGLISE